jgi:hypothetical protein
MIVSRRDGHGHCDAIAAEYGEEGWVATMGQLAG